MGKYDQYIITTPRPLEYTHFRLPPDVRRSVTWADSTVVDGMCNMECIWYYKPLSGPPHHVETDTDEILAFIGTNHEDPEDLGGIIRFRFEDEWVPFKVEEVRTPILHICVTPQRKYAKHRQKDGADLPQPPNTNK